MDNKFLNPSLRGITAFMLLFVLFGAAPGSVLFAQAAPGDTTRVSVDSSGAQGNNYSRWSSLSADGRYVTFVSSADNLVPGDTNTQEDIFVHDRQTRQTTRVSLASNGEQANGSSDQPTISSDGRYIAFYSEANNLVSGDTNGVSDIFVYDRQTGRTTRASVDSSGAQGNDASSSQAISGNGQYVAFLSHATNLVSGDTNGVEDIFVHDLQTGGTTRVSVDSGGAQANSGSGSPSISNDGRFVAFQSTASNLVSGDTNGVVDIFVHDRQTGATSRVSVSSSGAQAERGSSGPDISGDGRYVAFSSSAESLVPGYIYESYVYVHDRQTGQTTRESLYSDGNHMIGVAEAPAISGDGRYVAFHFDDRGDGLGLYEVFVHDRQTGATSLASTPMTAQHPYDSEDSSAYPAISGDGRIVAFQSVFSSMVPNDTNGAMDIFAHEVSFASNQQYPTVLSILQNCPRGCFPAADQIVDFSVNFSENVTSVTPDDFVVTMGDGISGAFVAEIVGSGKSYIVAVNTGSGNGTIRLDATDNDSIADAQGNPLGGTGAGNGDFQTGDVFFSNKSIPTVVSSVRADPDPTPAGTVRFTVTFSEEVSGVDAGDFTLTTTGGISGAGVAGVDGSGTTYTITVNTGSGDGTIRLDIIDDDSIQKTTGTPLGGPGAGNGNFSTGESYTVTKSGPSLPSVTSILRADPNPTAADLVSFTVTFTEPVTGVDTGDFSLTATGDLSGALVANMSGSGTTYIVLAATGSGEAGLRLDVLDDDSILSASGSPLGGTGAGNGAFTSGEAYTVDKAAPSVNASVRADPNPTATTSVNFTVVFSEPVSGVDVSDFSLATTGNITGAGIGAVSGSGSLYTVSVGTGSGDGTLRLDVLDNDSIVDGVGHPLAGAGVGNGNFNTGEEYTLARAPVTKITETIRSNGANDGWVLESAEDSTQGGFKDAGSTTLVLGDDAADRQFRVILHFPTNYLPDNAVITRVLLMLKGEGVVGSNPFDTHQNILVDIRSGAFGFIGPFPYRGLQVSDFQSPAHRDAVGTIQNNPLNGWYFTWLDPAAFEYVNLGGITQFRLRFQLDDDDNMQYSYIRFYSGDHDGLADRPRLVVEYYLR